MKFSTQLFLNFFHGIFLGLILGLFIGVLGNELYPELNTFYIATYSIPILSIFFALIALVKGYNNMDRLLFPLFSTAGTILLPVILVTIVGYFIGLDRMLSLPPVLFKESIGLSQLDTQLSTYILAIILSLTFVAAFVSSLSINKRKRWSW